MIEIWESISWFYNEHSDTAELRSMLTGLFHMQAPQNQNYPYCNYQLIDITPDYYTTKGHLENCLVQFNLFDNSSSMEKLLRIYDEFIGKFDNANLDITNFGLVRLNRQGTISTKVKTIWQLNVNYSLLIE